MVPGIEELHKQDYASVNNLVFPRVLEMVVTSLSVLESNFHSDKFPEMYDESKWRKHVRHRPCSGTIPLN